jgi:hypothetical protein
VSRYAQIGDWRYRNFLPRLMNRQAPGRYRLLCDLGSPLISLNHLIGDRSALRRLHRLPAHVDAGHGRRFQASFRRTVGCIIWSHIARVPQHLVSYA